MIGHSHAAQQRNVTNRAHLAPSAPAGPGDTGVLCHWLTVAAAAGGLDDEHIAGPQVGLVGPAQWYGAAVHPLDPVAADLPRPTPGHPVRRGAAGPPQGAPPPWAPGKHRV